MAPIEVGLLNDCLCAFILRKFEDFSLNWNKGYLAKSTTWNQFLLIAYIVFLTKLQKRQTL